VRQCRIGGRRTLATLKDLRQAFDHTQQELAGSLGVSQDAISRIESRSDMLLSTLRRYVEAMGGRLDLVARFPDRAPVILDHLSSDRQSAGRKARRSKSR
jgi:transcriptional regulator with XRE-family HTH domain